MDCSPPCFSQARILEWVAIFFSRGSSLPRDRTQVSYIGRQILYHWATRVSLGNCCCLVTQSCLIVCSPMEWGPPGSSVRGIFQARILEWVAISFSRGSSQPRNQTRIFCIADIHFTVWATREAILSTNSTYFSWCNNTTETCIICIFLKYMWSIHHNKPYGRLWYSPQLEMTETCTHAFSGLR